MSSVQRATKLLKLKPYKIPVVYALHQPHPNKRLRFCNWVLEKVNCGELDAKEIFLLTRRDLYGHVCSQNYQYYSDWKTERVFGSSGCLMPREAAGWPAKAASDSHLLPRIVFGWLCIIQGWKNPRHSVDMATKKNMRGIQKETSQRPRNRNQYLYVRSIGPDCCPSATQGCLVKFPGLHCKPVLHVLLDVVFRGE